MTQEQIAERVGRSRPAVANALRLLSLPPDVLRLLENNTLSAGHARALLTLPQVQIMSAAEKIIAEGLSVRQTEQFAKRLTAQNKAPPPKNPSTAPTFYREVELALASALSRRIRVFAKGDGKGELTVAFYNKEELTEFARRLAANGAAESNNPALPHEMKQRIGDDHA